MFDVLMKAQQAMLDTQKKLDGMTVDHQANGVSVTVTGNRKITSITIDPATIEDGDTEQLEEVLLSVLNRALEKAEALNNTETQKVTSNMLPPGFNIPGLF
ncbi:MAG TPA: YbaB/EbfC family nucleoid-associated protein [Chitinophagales bacterium]|nr:YbaB/EbfC family nucleoid-associated protein [Chitinophagales bacterium]HNL07450.1 YbaB/EbfC family nucleoid-associated protein [Chitinophagales bacterium]